MAISHYPTGNRRHVEPIRYWRPAGSQTVFWALEMPEPNSGVPTARLLPMIKWGNDIFLGVEDGIRIGLSVYNGRGAWVAYPTFVGGANLWDGGPSQPERCAPNHMWEVQPYGSKVMDAVMNPSANKGRPLRIVRSGQGLTVSEAKFETQEYRGDVVVYERLQLGGGRQGYRPTNEGQSTGPAERSPQSLGGPARSKGGVIPAAGDPDLDRGRAGIGLGQEEYRAHHHTGIQYQRNAQPVIFLRTEFRSDLQRELGWALGPDWYWAWELPTGRWWDNPWAWRPHSSTAPEVPVAPGPHRPRR